MITRRLTSCLAFFIGMLLTASVHIRGKEAVVDTPNFDSKKNATTSVGSESLSLKRRQPSGRTTIIFGTGKIDDEEKILKSVAPLQRKIDAASSQGKSEYDQNTTILFETRSIAKEEKVVEPVPPPQPKKATVQPAIGTVATPEKANATVAEVTKPTAPASEVNASVAVAPPPAADAPTTKKEANATLVAKVEVPVLGVVDANTSVAEGNATVVAGGNATVVADGNATVVADGNATVVADGNATVVADGNATVPVLPFSAADFFAGALDAATAGGGDAMGTQRLVDVKSAKLTPSLAFGMSYNYTSNPDKNDQKLHQDGFNSVLSLTFNMGLGEYSVGDEILLTPSLMLMQMRTYNDPVRDYGSYYELFDVDVQIAGITVPIILPNDFTLALGATYVRPISFRNDNVINYSTTPNLALTKIIPLPIGDILSITAGVSYAITSGDTLEDQLAAQPVYYNFIEAAMLELGTSPLLEQPVNLQDVFTQNLNFTYIKPIGEKLTLTPSVAINMMHFTKGSNQGRVDRAYNAGLNAAYMVFDWMSFSAAANYMLKSSTDSTLEFEDFIGGVTMGFNYAF